MSVSASTSTVTDSELLEAYQMGRAGSLPGPQRKRAENLHRVAIERRNRAGQIARLREVDADRADEVERANVARAKLAERFGVDLDEVPASDFDTAVIAALADGTLRPTRGKAKAVAPAPAAPPRRPSASRPNATVVDDDGVVWAARVEITDDVRQAAARRNLDAGAWAIASGADAKKLFPVDGKGKPISTKPTAEDEARAASWRIPVAKVVAGRIRRQQRAEGVL